MSGIVLLDQIYVGETLADVSQDVEECLDERFAFSSVCIPVDEHGFATGTFRVSVIWEPDEESIE